MNTRLNKRYCEIYETIDMVEPDFTIEYCMKENTRRVKRSHERKPKYVAEESDDEDMEEEHGNNFYVTTKKDNSRRARKEALTPPKKSDKKVTFVELDYEPKPFRIPAGRYVKKIIDDENMKIRSSNTYLSRRSKRLLKTEIKNYYESEDENENEE